MASRKKSDKPLPRAAAKAIDTIAETDVRLTPQLRFSAAGTEFGAVARAVETEPVFDEAARREIQGNIIPGFLKDHQHFLFFGLGQKASAKKWLKWIGPQISSMDEVLAFNRLYRAMRDRLGTRDVPMKATWVNIAFSSGAITTLVSKNDLDAFGDESFKQGLAARSEYLGDPTRTTAAGHKQKWAIGGPKNEADILVIVASDGEWELAETVDRIRKKAAELGLPLMFEQRGDTLPGTLRGHEHFGFKDGVSQPAVRGRVSAAPADFIVPRYIDPADSRAKLFAKPGQPLVWPGQFLLGERRQSSEDLYASIAPSTSFPKWARHGSFIACRRLRQDVRAFWEFVASAAATVGMPAEQFASMLVGRWPSGAPVMRAPKGDNPALAADDLANNHFLFDDPTRPSALLPVPGYPGDTFPQAAGDFHGLVCPHFAHIRKANPRDSATDLGKSADTLLRAVLRRGIPFGPPVMGVANPPESLWKKERGLMFLCYQSSIEDQFELLARRWANSPLQPNAGGHDPIIGQSDDRGNRERFIDFPKGGKIVRIPITNEWVIPTGGGYFFAPPVGAVAGVLGA